MKTAVPISCDWCSADELATNLRDCIPETADSAIVLQIQQQEALFRGPVSDPAVLVALVAGGGAAVSALISSVFRLLEKNVRTPGKIVIRGSNGTTVEAPSDLDELRLRHLAEFASSLGEPRIHLITSDKTKTR